MDPRACFCTHTQGAFGREEVGKGLTVSNVSRLLFDEVAGHSHKIWARDKTGSYWCLKSKV